MRAAFISVLLALVGCAGSEPATAHSPTLEPAVFHASASETYGTAAPARRETLVLGQSDAYDPMTTDTAPATGGPSNVIIVNQQQTVNGGYGYGYGVPYGSYRYGYGTPLSPEVVRPVTPRTTPGLVPGGNWPTPPSYGPRMLGDRSR